MKQEDNKRIIELVERAHAEDPRIKLFKEKAKKEKAAKKWEKESGSRKAAEEAAAKRLQKRPLLRKPPKKLRFESQL